MIVPTIFGQLIILIYNMADTFYLGQVNDPYMVAGISLVLPVFNLTLCLVGIGGVGGGTLISRLLGNGREEEARRVSCFTFYLSILAALTFSFVMAAGMTPILRLLGASTNTFLYAQQYVYCVIVLGAVPTVLSNVISNLLRSVGRSKEAGFGIAMGGVINIILDPLFMFVVLPAGKEVLGVGIATLLSNCISCAYFLIILLRIRGQSVLTISCKEGLPERRSILSIFSVGIPSAVATFLFDLDYIVIDRLMVSYSDIALAAIGIVLKVERLPLNVGVGICQGMMPLVAYNYSAKNERRMFGFISASGKLGLCVAAVSIALYEVFAAYIVRFFIPDPQTVALAVQFLRIRVLATPLMFLSFFTVYLFQAFGKGRVSLFLGIMRWAVLNIPMLLLLNQVFGMYGIVWTQVTADTINVILSLYIYRSHQKNLIQQDNTK